MESLKSWFRGFEQGIADLQPQQREVLFRACAVNCVHGGPVSYTHLVRAVLQRPLPHARRDAVGYLARQAPSLIHLLLNMSIVR